jgi:hypothetical protein
MSKQPSKEPRPAIYPIITEITKDLKFFDTAKFIYTRDKFFHLHIPLALSRILEMREGDQATIFANIDQKIVVLKIQGKK